MMADMAKVLSVSTKTGDKGSSSLANGVRMPKDHPVFEAIGTLDELNSWLGLITAELADEFSQYKELLLSVQDTLFYLGAELAQSPTTTLEARSVRQLERAADKLQLTMADGWHHRFLLPGGTTMGAYLDIARTVCRRAERAVVGLQQELPVRPVVLRYLNRLSDYLYVLRCFINHALQYEEKQFVSQNKRK